MVWMREKMIQPIDDGVDVQNRFPVLPQNIEANISLQINIWMINLRFAFHLWCLMRVNRRYTECEREGPPYIITFIRPNSDFKVHKIVFAIWKRYDCSLGQVQLADIFVQPQFTSTLLLYRSSSVGTCSSLPLLLFYFK